MRRMLLAIAVCLWSPAALAGGGGIASELYKEGVKLGNADKIEEALSKFQKAVFLEPKQFLYQLKLAYAYEMLGRIAEARATYEAALALKSDSPEAHNGLGNVLRRTRLFDLAEKEYQAAMKLKKNYAEAMRGLAVLYAETDKLDAAADMYVKALKANPKDSEVAFKAANVYWRQKKFDEAATYYRKAIELKPDYNDAHFGLGITLKEKGDVPGAKEALKKACDGGVKEACKHLFKLN